MLQGLDPVFYEHANLTVAILCWTLFLIFVRYLIIEIQVGRLSWDDWTAGRMMLRHQMAMAIGSISAGEAINRTWTFAARFAANENMESTWMREWDVPKIGMAILAVGLLCGIKVFSPDDWGNRSWIICAALVVVLNVALALIHQVY